MMFRRRLTQKFIILFGIVFVFVFIVTLSQFDDIEKSNNEYRAKLLKEKIAKESIDQANKNREFLNIENAVDLRAKVSAKFANRYRFSSNNNNNDDALIEQPNEESYLNEQHLESTFKIVSKMNRLVHLDLKGAPPKLNYLKEFIPFIKRAGATGILVEYDDFFPYKNDLEAIKNQNHYTNQEIQSLIKLAQESNLVVVPLIQTMNNLEFVLKLKQYSNLRQTNSYFNIINPCLNDTYDKLIFKIIDQVVDSHPNDLEYVHIGCNQVKAIDLNSDSCKHLNLGSYEDLFIYHLDIVSSYLRSKRPTLKIMIWDDLLRDNQISAKLKRVNKLKIVPMISNDKEVVDIDFKILKKYIKYFDEFWIASAFKGATSELEIVPNARKHYRNQLSWLNLISKLTDPSKLKGITFLGASRYDHMQAICEILPASVPSLVLSLQTIVNYDQSETDIFKDVKLITNCDYSRTQTGFLLNTQILLSHDDWPELNTVNNYDKLYKCQFPGSDMYNWLLDLKLTIQYFERNHLKFSNILNEYNLKYKFFNTISYDQAVHAFYPTIREKLNSLLKNGEKLFDKYFYADLYEELTNIYIIDNINKINLRLSQLNKTSKPDFAPIRPFNRIEHIIL